MIGLKNWRYLVNYEGKSLIRLWEDRDGTSTWKEITQRGMLDPSSQGPMLTDSPKTAKIMPINPPQNWTSTNTANLESNGVSVTIVSGTGSNKLPESLRGISNNSVTITPANVSSSTTTTNGTNFERRKVPSEPTETTMKDGGMAKCEHCGKLGVKHAFYTKKRNFCSNSCVRAASKTTGNVERAKILSPAVTTKSDPIDDEESSRGSSVHDGTRSTSSASNSYSDQEAVPAKRNKFETSQGFEWNKMLNESNFVAANVSCFKHAPVSYLWENVTVGMKVEVENTDVDQGSYQTAFWVASVIQIQGYKVLLRFEGFGNDNTRDFWVNLCSEDVHHVGWCATKGKPLIPPKSISGKFADWRDFLVKRLTGARTLPQNFQTKVASGLKSRYELDAQLEVVDKNRICQLRLATVQKIVGKRLHVRYFDSDEDGGFWCHEDSPLIHPPGWASTVGHEIVAPKNYRPDTLSRSSFKFSNYEQLDLKEGMKVEAIDPLNLSAICAATIKKVLKMGYIMIRVDCYEEDASGSDWFCYHITSPYIFPCGFSAANGVVLTPPLGYAKDTFEWQKYLQSTNTKAAPLRNLKKTPLEHELKVKMRLEAADLMDPRLICVATISQVVGRLLKIHFDGWEEEYDQWLDATSPDIYPVGWCELVGHRLEPPHAPVVITQKKVKKQGIPKVRKKIPRNKHMPHKPAPKNSNRFSSTKVSSTLNNSNTHTSAASMSQGMSDGESSRRRATVPNVPVTLLREDNGPQRMEITGVVSADKKTDEKNEANLGLPVIPRLIGCPSISEMDEVDPQQWKVNHVKEFLQINECGTYCESFSLRKIDGPKLMSLTKDQIIVLTGMKVGPAVKILDLISQLRRLVQAARVRNSALSK
ncbi:unnamed protein product [Allacma fusca]|uniref:Polycomb protein Sfmbt n=1 Tax=Allacma fusca TaxID=39272 RepID=A0A8J2J5U0_9HEXA|nr:unnamed protein product [Allacma fusca]